jgi:hypothetical protein
MVGINVLITVPMARVASALAAERSQGVEFAMPTAR